MAITSSCGPRAEHSETVKRCQGRRKDSCDGFCKTVEESFAGKAKTTLAIHFAGAWTLARSDNVSKNTTSEGLATSPVEESLERRAVC